MVCDDDDTADDAFRLQLPRVAARDTQFRRGVDNAREMALADGVPFSRKETQLTHLPTMPSFEAREAAVLPYRPRKLQRLSAF